MLALLFSFLLWFQPAHAEPSFRQAPDPVAEQPTFRPETPDDWIRIEGPYLTVHAHPQDQKAGLRLSRRAATRIPELVASLGVPAGGDIDVYLATSENEFRTLQPGSIPDWADGTAWPTQGLIFLKSPRIRSGTAGDLAQVLDHELVHVLLGRAFAPNPVPTWLQEGVAQVVAGEYVERHARALESGLLGGSLLSLQELAAGFPADPIRANLAYAQSADLVAFLQGQFGEHALSGLIANMAQGQPFGRALRNATGLGPAELDERWRTRIESSPLWLSVVASDTAMFGVGAVLMVWGAVLARRRNRRRLDEWSREEALQDALMLTIERQGAQAVAIENREVWVHQPSNWVH